MEEYKFFDNLSNLYGEQKYLSKSALLISIYRVDVPYLTFTCELPAKMPEPSAHVLQRKDRIY